MLPRLRYSILYCKCKDRSNLEMVDSAILLGTNIGIFTSFLNNKKLYVRSFGHAWSRVDNWKSLRSILKHCVKMYRSYGWSHIFHAHGLFENIFCTPPTCQNLFYWNDCISKKCYMAPSPQIAQKQNFFFPNKKWKREKLLWKIF